MVSAKLRNGTISHLLNMQVYPAVSTNTATRVKIVRAC